MALTQVVERMLGLGKPSGGLVRDCFTSLLEASVRLRQMQEGKEEDDGEAENDDAEEEIEDYEEVSLPNYLFYRFYF